MSSATDSVEQQLYRKLSDFGFEKTRFVTETASIWIHTEKKRHLVVPNATDGFYPSWMIDQLLVQARTLGDDSLVAAIASVGGLDNFPDKNAIRKSSRKSSAKE